MMPSGPHRSTMGTGERSNMPTVVFRLSGHSEIGPKLVFDQSSAPIRAPFSPPPNGKCLSCSAPLTLGISHFLRNGTLFEFLEHSQRYLFWEMAQVGLKVRLGPDAIPRL